MTIDIEKLEDIRRVSSPVRTALTVVIAVMLAEAVIMAFLHRIHELSPWMETIIDSLVLGCVVTPVLYVTIVRPLRALLAEYHQSQSGLENAKQELEREVRKQTDELHKANLLLQADVRIRQR
jgi:cobalamin biosynthesis protein CobD/CbiB